MRKKCEMRNGYAFFEYNLTRITLTLLSNWNRQVGTLYPSSLNFRVRLGDTPAVIAGTPDVIAGTSAVIVGTPKLIKRHKFYDGE